MDVVRAYCAAPFLSFVALEHRAPISLVTSFFSLRNLQDFVICSPGTSHADEPSRLFFFFTLQGQEPLQDFVLTQCTLRLALEASADPDSSHDGCSVGLLRCTIFVICSPGTSRANKPSRLFFFT